MKRAKNIFIAIIIISAIISGIWLVKHDKTKKEVQQQEKSLGILYKWQNAAFGENDTSVISSYEYVTYDKMDECRLYIYISAYNDLTSGEHLTMDEVKQYLSDEKNDDGTLRVEKGYEKIRAYVMWWGDNQENIQLFYDQLYTIFKEYKEDHPDILGFNDLNLDQVKELVIKYQNPSYEISDLVMEAE